MSKKQSSKNLGFGLGLRSPHYSYIIKNTPKVSWFEIISENYIGMENAGAGRPLEILKEIRKNYPIVMHGVSLSIGSADPINMNYLKKIKNLMQIIEPAWVSDHICWTGVDQENLHDLLPLPYTEEVIEFLVSKISRVQDFLGRRMLFENVSSYFSFKESEMPEWEFISDISKRAGCGILLDINNIYVSSVNHGYNPFIYLNSIPRASVEQFHLAGHSNMGKYLIDTHDHPISQPVWDLYEKAVERFGPTSTLIERDDHIPEFNELIQELNHAKSIEEKIVGKKNGFTQKTATSSAPAMLGHY